MAENQLQQLLRMIDGPVLIPSTLEALKRAAKDRKSLLDDAQQAAQAAVQGGAEQPLEGQLDSLDNLISSLQGIKRKLEDVSKTEREEAARVKARLEHLQQLTVPKDNMIVWNKQRMDRMLVDYLNRCGYHEAASLLAAQQPGLSALVDTHIFEQTQQVVEALRGHDCSRALAWCADNRAKLRKIKSRLEFKLRVQEFLELVRAERRMDAIAHARAHLAPWAGQHMGELQRAVATLAFGAHTGCARYAPLFDASQWEGLVTLFLQDLYRLHSLPPESQLVVHLQAGLAALKTPASYAPGCARDDPLALPAFRQLAEGLPWSKHVHSKLLCAVTRSLMTDANPAVALPNGYVYSQRAVDLICAQNGGRMVCPKTGAVFAADELRRVYIA
uniref:Macrophage erythroblast attacher n=1 Tax=Chlamydomonas leiostraca TaxID=1034604 RepID=A0A7S0WRW8_9CHLO|mmetsp:Transcript_25750/g.65482  ORF Transcript_25750/g.65482 Transcript_25750/m.65482 type:complete len:388 (+) Transcript_25750:79-1242(+)